METRGFPRLAPRGFLLRRRLPARDVPLRSCAGSTDCHRQSGGQDVAGRVHVTVVDRSATAGPSTYVQRHVARRNTADRAQLGGRKPAIDHDHPPSVPSRFVFQHVPELTPARVTDGASEATVADHVRHREVFDHKRLILTHESSGDLVKMVGTPVGDPGVDTAELETSFGPVGAADLLSTQDSLGSCQPDPLAAPVPGIGDLLPGRERQEMLKADVNAHDRVRGRQRSHAGVVTQQGNEPTSGSISRHGDCRGHRTFRQRSGPADVQRFGHLRQRQHTSAPTETRTCVLGARSRPLTRLESWVPGASRPEVGERSLQMPERLLQRHRRDIVEKRQFLSALPGSEYRRCGLVADSFLAVGPGLCPSLQCEIVNLADTSERARQLCGLSPGRVEAVFERPLHLAAHQPKVAACRAAFVRLTLFCRTGIRLHSTQLAGFFSEDFK
ncbi:hypothetical protein SAMN04488564_12634 [Lentzea waywayandensis]|uniref:Uncharacterized protein n=1 Tax=Lentzea waywayandensis TaxID=84724 RepID=A0A1I6FJD8_9PSEU|nr:hypothetical protein SAMN04488564_12634 [Lentzea waywayandensis]